MTKNRTKQSAFIPVFALVILCGLLPACTDEYPVSPNAEYISFGDSATHGPGLGESYPWFLQQKLFPGMTFDLNDYSRNKVDNRGKSGDSASNNTRLNDYLDQNAFPYAHTVLYLMGANDMILEFCNRFQGDEPLEEEIRDFSRLIAQHIANTVQTFRDGYGLDVMVGRYFQVSQGYDAFCIGEINQETADRINAGIDIFHEEVEGVLSGLGLELVPAESYSLGPDGYQGDGLHPTAAGSKVMAEKWCKAITGWESACEF